MSQKEQRRPCLGGCFLSLTGGQVGKGEKQVGKEEQEEQEEQEQQEQLVALAT
jgi:hypothetical protein